MESGLRRPRWAVLALTIVLAPVYGLAVSATGGTVTGPAGAYVALDVTATVTDAPESNAELQVESVTWEWETLAISDATGASVDIAPYFEQPDPSAPDAALVLDTACIGTFTVDLKASVTYRLSDGTTVKGEGTTAGTVTVTPAQ